MSTPLNKHARDIFPPLLSTSRKRNYRQLSLKPAYHITLVPPCQGNFSQKKTIFILPNTRCSVLVAPYSLLVARYWGATPRRSKAHQPATSNEERETSNEFIPPGRLPGPADSLEVLRPTPGRRWTRSPGRNPGRPPGEPSWRSAPPGGEWSRRS